MSSNRLAKMVVSDEPTMIDIPVYYTFRKNKYGIEKLVILEDEEAKKLLDDETRKGEVEVLNSKWAIAGWEIQNQIVAQSQERDQMTGRKEPNWATYRELRISYLLREWDLQIDGKVVPITPQYIKNCPAEIMLALFNKYERVTGGDPDEEGKQ